ncbi:MAG: carboxypeptidase-like regulatory domain-containing protein [Bacteroidota bacterium]
MTIDMKKARFILLSIALLFLVGVQEGQAQKKKSKLEVTVVDDLGDVVEDAKVSIYKSKMMFDKGNAPIYTEQTNKKGRVTFKNLAATEYYIAAIKGEKNNMGKSGRSGKLSKGKAKEINVMIE